MADPIGLAQVGVGYWGKNLLRNFTRLQEARVLATYDHRQQARDEVAREYGDLFQAETYEEMLARPGIEAVVIATDTPNHFELAKQALSADKHVFVEKPMTQTVAQAEELVRLSEERGLHLMVGHLLLYHPAYQYVQQAVKSGQLGDVYYLYAVRANLGIVRQRENVLESLAPHDIAVALAMLPGKPIGVSAQGSAYLQPGIEDVCFTTVFFEGGALAHLHSSWLDPNKIRKLTVVGSERMAVVDDLEGREKIRLYDRDLSVDDTPYADYAGAISVRAGDIIIPRVDTSEPLKLECRHFVECVQMGQTPRTNGRSGLAVMRILSAARESLKDRGVVVDL